MPYSSAPSLNAKNSVMAAQAASLEAGTTCEGIVPLWGASD